MYEDCRFYLVPFIQKNVNALSKRDHYSNKKEQSVATTDGGS